MKKSKLFDKYYIEYDNWFLEHSKIYKTEIKTIKKILPPFKKGLEIGVGTGRFAKPLGINLGIEPSKKMAEIAKKRGIKVVEGYAEKLPFEDNLFDLVLMVTTICFVSDIDKSLKEANRVLKKGGHIIIAFIDKNSKLGQFYEKNRKKSRFYKEATFYNKDEIIDLMKTHGFAFEDCAESLFGDNLKNINFDIFEGCEKGGAFVVLKGKKI